MTPALKKHYDPDSELRLADLVDTNSGALERGVCALPYQRQRDGKTVYFPVNLIGNLFVSNGMSAGNTACEARVQALSEIFERWIKFKVIADAIALPSVPDEVIARYPNIASGIADLRAAGFGIQQGRALEQLSGFPEPGFDQHDIAEWQNLETHFIDSSGVVHWNFLRDDADFDFADWNFAGDTRAEYRHLLEKLHAEGHEVYITGSNARRWPKNWTGKAMTT